MQHCGPNVDSGVTFGVASSLSGGIRGIAEVQNRIQEWQRGGCAGDSGGKDFDFLLWSFEPQLAVVHQPGSNTTTNPTYIMANSTTLRAPFRVRRADTTSHLSTRAPAACAEIKVESKNNCYKLAERCGLSSVDQFYAYNNGIKSRCSQLQIGQRVCCTAGGLASRRQKVRPDGTCATYRVLRADTCDSISANFDITTEELKKFNEKKTWGWGGCGTALRFDTIICVSEGEPPMPDRLKGATCGPQADKNTPRPPKGSSFADLNPCPLNA